MPLPIPIPPPNIALPQASLPSFSCTTSSTTTESIASPSDMNSPQVLIAIALLKNSVKTRWNNRCRSYTLKEKKDVLAQVDEMRKENPSMLITLAMEQLGLPNVYYMLVGRKM